MAKQTLGGLAPAAAILAAIFAWLYAVSFVVLKNPALFSAFLAVGGLLSVAVFVELHQRLAGILSGAAMLALILGALAAFGSLAHGGYDLAYALHPVALPPGAGDLPSSTDPRGLATFGLAGLAILVWSGAILHSGAFSRGLGWLGILSGILLLLIYLARLVILDAAHPAVLVPALIEGFLVSPVWYLWLGVSLLQRPRLFQPL
ncbi:MAG TPA: hypothetical protein VK009_00845 [Chloroflexota bacterium]|nr:hypothetical protein [Chloroflexota bacterium]